MSVITCTWLYIYIYKTLTHHPKIGDKVAMLE